MEPRRSCSVVLLLVAGLFVCLAIVSGAAAYQVATMHPMGTTATSTIANPAPTELPPSHLGGWVSNTGGIFNTPTPGPVPTLAPVLPTPGAGLASGQQLGGFPDVGVFAAPPANAQIITALISHYWPPLGGPNCSNYVNGECLAHMSDGERWQDYTGRAVACPKEYKFGTRFYAFGREWICKDRGGAITRTASGDWLDFLIPNAPLPYGSQYPVAVVYP